jgi:REP element-mobilizing transposase RayT
VGWRTVEPSFFNPLGDVRFTRHNLPHWQQIAATYFVTFRLADSLPTALLRAWMLEREAWLRARTSPLSMQDEATYHRLFSSRIDGWLDAGHGACALRQEEARAVVCEALRFFDGERYVLWAWVVMPNHVHVCFSLAPGWAIERVVFTWKRRSAGEINRLRGQGGAVWQRDYFDRLVRDEGHFARVLRYIEKNPERARLREGEFAAWAREPARL